MTKASESWLLVAALGFATACNDGAPPDAPDEPEPLASGELSPPQYLVRISMAIRGTRPSARDLRDVAEDPDLIPALVDEYLEDPRFGETVRMIHNDAILVGVEAQFPAAGPLADQGPTGIGLSVMHNPLRLVEYVVLNDRPYTEIVTADYAVPDHITSVAYGMAEAETAPWPAPGRPAAGILSDSAVFLRHRSDATNYHRGRANAISKALLCVDFLDRDIEVDGSIDLSDPEAVAEAVTTNEACVACHVHLDGLASFFWGYPGNLNPAQIESYPIPPTYQAQAADNWRYTTGHPPTYFGTPADGLEDLGQLIADDPRFSLCAAKRFYAFFTQVSLEDVPLENAAELQDALIDSGFDAKEMVRTIVLSDEFKRSWSDDEEEAEALMGLKKARPAQLARAMEDLTGFRWETNVDAYHPQINEGDVDLMRTNSLGFAVLGGGIDGYFVEAPSYTTNTTSSLLLRTHAAEAAAFAVENAEGGLLFTHVDVRTRSEDDIRVQLADFHLRMYGELVEAQSEEVDESYAVFAATLERTGDVEHAWKTTLTAMLQDLRIAYY